MTSYHTIKLANGMVLKVVSSIPEHLQKYVDTCHLSQEQDKFDTFKKDLGAFISAMKSEK